MYEFDDSAAAIGVFLLTIFMVIIFYIATPAHSQEAGPPCGPAADVLGKLQKQYGETVTAAGVVGSQYMVITTSKQGTFTILMRRPDGTACLIVGGEGFALADPAPMKGSGL